MAGMAWRESERELRLKHGPQKMLKGRETRGVGVVWYGEDAKQLLQDALAKGRERVIRKVEMDKAYKSSLGVADLAPSPKEDEEWMCPASHSGARGGHVPVVCFYA